MSLSGYEELTNDDDTTAIEESTAMRDDSAADYSTNEANEEDRTAMTTGDQSSFQGEDSMLDDAELSGSTPRPPATKTIQAQVASLESPYEAMKREMKGEEDGTTVLEDDPDDSSVLFAQQTARLPDMSMTPKSLVDIQKARDQSPQRHKDPLLHRVLDKNYRVQATPHKPALRISPLKGKESERRRSKGKTPDVPAWQDSPASSPEMAVPKLRSAAFMSPYKSTARQRLVNATQGPRTPGVSLQTPGAGRKTKDVFANQATPGNANDDDVDWDIDVTEEDDLDLYAGMSPPKTIQFALPPSKLLQTPGMFFLLSMTTGHFRSLIRIRNISPGSEQENCRRHSHRRWSRP